MKILKIFGLVVGIHVFALVIIFANPGCSTATKPPPAPSDTMIASSTPPVVTAPATAASGVYTSAPDSVGLTAAPHAAPPAAPAASAPAPVLFDPNAPASASSGSSSTTVRFTPTRPGTPVAGTLVAEKVPDVTPATTHIVKSGDSLWSIAKKHKLSVADLTAANGIAANANLQPGKKLLIPAKSLPATAAATATSTPPKAAEAPAPRATGESAKHTVKTGETLGVIARNYGVRQSDIAVANRISDPAKIQAGMELIIPGVSATGARSGKSGKSGTKAPAPEKVESAAPTPAPEAAKPVAPPVVPIIKIDETPVTPAPKP
jgi:LysM repeat protein